MQTVESNNLEVANTIAGQIGHKAFVMMGTTFKTGSSDSLTFNVTASRKFSHVKITLDPSDTYTVKFFKIRGAQVTAEKEFEGVYADGLHQLIESVCKIRMSL